MTAPSPRSLSCDLVNRNDARNVNGYSIVCCPSCPLRRAIETLEKGGVHWDVELKSGLTSFHVHKRILAEKSAVFRRLVQGGVTTLDVDLDSLCLHRLLSYIYTKELEDKSRNVAFEMLVVAENFEVEELEESCATILEEYFKRRRRDKRYRMVLAQEKIPKTKAGEVFLAGLVSPYN